MSYLLAATDFSETGSNAVRYACSLARQYNFEVVVLHSFVLPLIVSDLPIPALTYDEALVSAEDSMAEALSALRDEFGELSVRGMVYYGELLDGIAEYTEKNGKPYLVMLGNSNTGEHANWLDSHMMDVFRNLTVPVVGIPPEMSLHPVSKICFAWDSKSTGVEAAITQLGQLVRLFQAQLHVLVTDADVRNQDNAPSLGGPVVDQLKRMGANFHYLNNVSIEGVVAKFVEDYAISWLAVIPRHHSMLGSIFHRSHTKGIAHRVHIPLGALPEKI